MAFDIEGARKEGYTDAEIADHLSQQQRFDVSGARSEGYSDADIIGHLAEKQAAALPKYDRQPASAGTRFVRGLREPTVGLGQLVAHGAAAAGGLLPAGNTVRSAFEDNAATYDDFAKQYGKDSAEIAPEGMDWARLGGNALPLAAATVATGGGVVPGMLSIARAGAAGGALAGAATPVADDGFWTTKALQTGGGAVAGAVLSPVAQKMIGAVGSAGTYALNRLRALGQQATPQTIEIQISQALQQHGIDPENLRRVAPQYFAQIARDVSSALKVGGQIDPTALANRAAFELVGARPTAGQVSGEGVQYGKEMFLRNAPGGEELQGQYQNALEALNARLGDLQGKAAAPLRDYQAGQRVQGALSNADAAMSQRVKGLYDTAAATAGRDIVVDGPAFAQSALGDIEYSNAAGALRKASPDTVRLLNDLTQGKMDLTVTRAQEVFKALNRAHKGADDEGRFALGIVRKQLHDALDQIQPGDAAARDAYRAATAAAREQFGIYDAVPALKAVAEDAVPPDDFMRKFVYGASQEDFQRLRAFLRPRDRGAWDQIKGQIVSDLREAASKSGDPKDFSQAGFNKAFRSLEQSGKLDLLFAPSELQTLRAVGRVGQLVQQPPPGVSTTGLGGAAKAMGWLAQMISGLGKLGPAGKVAGAVATKGGNTLEAQLALRAPKVTTPPPLQLPPGAVNRLALAMPPAAGAGIANALALAFDASDPRETLRYERVQPQ